LWNKKKEEMSVKKTIAIVGATEKRGTEIASHLASANYRLLLVSHDMNRLAEVTEKILQAEPVAEIDSLECVKDGCWEADVILFAIACKQEKQVAELMKEVATQKIVVSISDERNTTEELQQLLPYSKIVKVSMDSSNEITITGNDEEANAEIADIFKNAGYKVKQPHHFSES
jgi:predicted dinucleotide-binding enzyme